MVKYESWEEFFAQPLQEGFYKEMLESQKALRNAISFANPKKVLEIGVGTASIAIQLALEGLKISSLDSNARILEQAKKNAEKYGVSIDFQFGDARKLPFADNSFEVAYSQGLFEHYSDKEIRKMLDEKLRVAKKAIVSVPSANNTEKWVGNERFLSIAKWKQIFSDHNLVKTEEYATLPNNKSAEYLFVFERKE